MTDRRDLERRIEDEALAGKVARIIDVLMGPLDELSNGRKTEEGLVAKVEKIDSRLTNGGVKIRLPAAAWAAIGVAIIAGAAQVIAAIVG